jgi:ubiquitin-like modifier-activating enzyme ATG7
MAAPLQFAPWSSDIELPFYSALFASKLDYDKLDDSARLVLGLYEPMSTKPLDSVKMRILGNALTSTQYVRHGPSLHVLTSDQID